MSGDTQTMLHVLLDNVVEDGDGGPALSSLESGSSHAGGLGVGGDVPALVEMLEAATGFRSGSVIGVAGSGRGCDAGCRSGVLGCVLGAEGVG